MAKEKKLELLPDILDFLCTLSRHHVVYMVVGAHALGYHHKPRATKDIDVWVDFDFENRNRLRNALMEFGAPPHVIEHVLIANNDDIIWFGTVPLRVDMLFKLPGLEFKKAIANAVSVAVDDVQISILGREDLIANKKFVNRPQDRVDVKNLLKKT